MLLGLQVLVLAALVAQFPVLATACGDVPVPGAEQARAVPTLGLSYVTCEYPPTGRFPLDVDLLTFPAFVALVLSALSTLLVAAGLLRRRARAGVPPAAGGRPPLRVDPLLAAVFAVQALALPAVAAQWPSLLLMCDEVFAFVDQGRDRDMGPLLVSCDHVTSGEPGTVQLWTYPVFAAVMLMLASMAVAAGLLVRRWRRRSP